MLHCIISRRPALNSAGKSSAVPVAFAMELSAG